jgi:hypothetical protein
METALDTFPILLQGYQELGPVFLAETDDWWTQPAHEQAANGHAVLSGKAPAARGAPKRSRSSRVEEDLQEKIQALKAQQQQKFILLVSIKHTQQWQNLPTHVMHRRDALITMETLGSSQERVKVLELMLNARSEQIQRLKAIQDGLPDDVLEGIGITIDRL